MKKILIAGFTFILIYINLAFLQVGTDSSYVNKIDGLEIKITKLKSLPADEQKKYQLILSDVENRKNSLKSLLKTPAAKRDKEWEKLWAQNYAKAMGALDNIK